jgi:transposase-like protein
MEMDPTKKNLAENEVLDGLLDQLLRDYKKPEDILGRRGLLKPLTKPLLERALGAELTEHLGYKKYDPAGYAAGLPGTEVPKHRDRAPRRPGTGWGAT